MVKTNTLKICVFQLIELRQDPHGMRKPASGISVGKEKLKCKNDLTSLDDKLRIANKVNTKYLALGAERGNSLEHLVREVGEEAEAVLDNTFLPAAKKKDGENLNFLELRYSSKSMFNSLSISFPQKNDQDSLESPANP